MDDELLSWNGVCAETGGPSLPPLSSRELVRAILQQPDPANLRELRLRRSQDAQSAEAMDRLAQLLTETEQKLRESAIGSGDAQTVQALAGRLRQLEQEFRQRQHLGVREGIDAQDLGQAGWGVIFADNARPEIIAALEPLLALRRAQAGARFRCYRDQTGYRSGGNETKSKFLIRSGATAAGPVSPEAVPYYLLLVGGPEQIPFEFQFQLDVQYAVGRIDFATVEEYACYARSVVAAEQQAPLRPAEVAFFGVANPGDRATQLSSEQLIKPLAEIFRSSEPGWQIMQIAAAEASRERLRQLLTVATPALLFTASHGVAFASGSSQQRSHQGALLCQDWPGALQLGPIPRHCYLAAEDIDDQAQLHGVILFLFACYSGGTPARDSFSCQATPIERAKAPFVAALPQRLLGHPGGGALAVIGHVDRAWGYSFSWSGGAPRVHTAAIESTLRRLLHGERIGYAMEYLNQRYAELATLLSDELGAVRNLRQPDERALAELWTATHDARSYCILGDPAVRLSATPLLTTK